MRKTLAAISILALVLATAGAALAAFSQTASVQFTAQKAGKSTGIKSDLHAVFDTAGPLKSPKQVVMTFPVNTRFNLGTKLVKRCTYSDKQLTAPAGAKVCPTKSQIGSGRGQVNLATTSGFPVNVKAYVHNAGSLIIVAKVPALATTAVIHAVVRGRKLTINVPNLGVVLTSLKLNVGKKGTGKRALITSGRCTAGHFKTSVRWTYWNSTVPDTATSMSNCS